MPWLSLADEPAQLRFGLSYAVIRHGELCVHGFQQIVALHGCAYGEQRCGGGTFLPNARVLCRDEHACEAWRQRKACESASHGADCAESVEERLRMIDRDGFGCVKPCDIAHAEIECAQGERELREVGAEDLRAVVLGALCEVGFCVQAQHTTRCGAACAASTLSGGSLADATDLECRKAGPR